MYFYYVVQRELQPFFDILITRLDGRAVETAPGSWGKVEGDSTPARVAALAKLAGSYSVHRFNHLTHMKFPSFFQFGPCHFVAFMSASRFVVVETYRFHFGVSVHESYTLSEGSVCISEQVFNAARNEVLSQMCLVDQNALFLAQIEAYEAEQSIILLD